MVLPRARLCLLAALAVVLLPAAARAQALFPLQANLSVVDSFDFGASPALGLYVGFAQGLGDGQGPTAFWGAGFSGSTSPWSVGSPVTVGAQLRFGLASPGDPQFVFPTAISYVLVEPYLRIPTTSPQPLLGDLPPVNPLGLRVGFGLTAPRWSYFMLAHLGEVLLRFADSARGGGFLALAVLLPLGFFDHLELSYDLLGDQAYGRERAFTFRIGAGF